MSKPKPKSPPRSTVNSSTLPQAEPLPSADAVLLEKLNSLTASQQSMADAESLAAYADVDLERSTKLRVSAFEKRSTARRQLVAAEIALALQLATRPGQPIRYNGETYVHIAGAGLQKFKGEPLALGVQS